MKNLTLPELLKDVTIVLPVINETFSLRKTVDILLKDNAGQIAQIIIIICERTTEECRVVCHELKEEHRDLVLIRSQRLPYVGGAVREGFGIAAASHVVMMAADLETDPALVKDLIAHARKYPSAIIAASRWLRGGGFSGYGKIKVWMNFMFQKLLRVLYRTNLTDMTYAYRIYPTSLVQAIQWKELTHVFFLESLLKPFKLGITIIEIPSQWTKRTEGTSQNNIFTMISYFWTTMRLLFSRVRIQ